MNTRLRGTPAQAVASPEMDQLLAAFHLVEPAPGLEERLLQRLAVEKRLGAAPQSVRQSAFRSWAPIGIAASITCLLGGGLLIGSATPPAAQAGLAANSSQPLAMAAENSPVVGIRAVGPAPSAAADARSTFAPASARRQPARGLRAGGRHGRSTRPAAARTSPQ
ncbi:MAG TPA: hypothetical protein VGD62_06670 [Acidobacteriaceae bacterium]